MNPAWYLMMSAMLLALLALCFVFAGFETGMISLDPLELERKAKKDKTMAKVMALSKKPDLFLGTTLIGNNIVNVLFATLATYMAHKIDSPYLPAKFSAIASVLIVLSFGEIVPKALFRDHAALLVPKFFPLIHFFYFLFSPLVAIVSAINRSVKKMLKLEDQNSLNFLTRDDLAFLLSQADADPSEQPQMDMLEDALEFGEHIARNVMVPRKDIVAIASDASLDEAIAIAREEGFTRYPVYGRDLDDILGVLIIYDILKHDCTTDMTAGKIIHKPYFAPENMDIDVLLKEMQIKRKTMAIIVDSYGGTSGIVTIEDILEEIVGDIEDEYDDDDESPEVQQISPNTWLVQADVEIDYLADEYGIELPEGDYETVAGLILDTLERIPQQGQFIDIPPYRLQVLQATNKKIIKVKIHKINNPEV